MSVRSPVKTLRTGGLLSAAWLVLLLLGSLTAGWWEPYQTDAQDPAHTLASPSGSHLLGTDDLGRDVLTRIAAGSWISVGPALLAVVVAFGIGIPLALAAAEHGRLVERGSSRFAELLLALPSMVILLAFVGAVGVHPWAIMTVLGVLLSAPVYRVFLSQAQSLRTRLYVDAARVNGVSSVQVNLRHVLPAMATTIAVQAAQLFAIGVLIEAGLAFMGFGPSVPSPSWGGLIAAASQHIYDDPWLMVPTGVVLALTVIAANVLADTVLVSMGGGQRERGRASAARRATRRPARIPAGARGADGIASAEREVAPDGAAGTGELLGVAGANGGAASALAEMPGGPGGLLDVRDLTVSVDGGPSLVTGVSFGMRPGTVLGLVGESGCGKTMTALALLGLLPEGVAVTGGSIGFGDPPGDIRDLTALTVRELRAIRGREIALISQEPMVALDPMFSVGYQLTQPIRRFRSAGGHRTSRAQARRIAAELLGQVGIVDAKRVLRSYPHQLSGGMAQRVCIALALTGSPKLLVADEPTTALDVTVQAEILSLLRSLVAARGLSVIIVSHDLGVIADLADEVAVMYAGQIVESGTVASVLSQPSHPYTTALLGANPHVAEGLPVPERLASIPGTVPAAADWTTGCRFASRCALATEACAAPVPLTRAHDAGTESGTESGTATGNATGGTGTVRCIHPLRTGVSPQPLPVPHTMEPGAAS
ncbi:MAG TPA: dipeptide/oligopeptide/nickel ABC transporter permease/ATP-binding protein [Trebonia sp.]|nr:dipeptide/oligopeptide/nickel ABC transporter permease/ATP-binding protein [Trebonia sp.]